VKLFNHYFRQRIRPMSDSANEFNEPDIAGFGAPKAVFRPDRGQTLAGMMIGACIVFVGFMAALLPGGLQLNGRILAVGVGLAGVGFTFWMYRHGRWRLAICAGGLVQVRTWGVDQIAWSEIREVFQVQMRGSTAPHKLTIVGSEGKMEVQPINCRQKKELFDLLLEEAKTRQLVISIHWIEIPDN
jgi:hypothetical protein